ncbi:MAG: hypothetical protein ABJN26_14050 [Stappiaceae bacterium]
MTKPPREGARWGDDPEPQTPPPSQPAPPSQHEILVDTYGETNVAKAYEVYVRMKAQAPHAQVMRNDETTFAKVILENAQRSVQYAAQDGRVHTFIETLHFIEKQLGAFLLTNPTWAPSDGFTISYGDEHEGHAYKRVMRSRALRYLRNGAIVGIAIGVLSWLGTGEISQLVLMPFFFSVMAAVVGGLVFEWEKHSRKKKRS